MTFRFAPLALAAGLTASLASAAQAPTLQVRQAWARPAVAGGTSAAYFEVRDPTAQADRLVGASCACAARAELHQMSMAGGVMRMTALPGGAAVPAHGALKLAPMGTHLMLLGVKSTLRAGDQVRLTLDFAKAGKLVVQVPIAATAPSGDMAGMGR